MASAPVIDIQLLPHPVQYQPIERFPKSCGGECVFIGRTRLENHDEHGHLATLNYEAFTTMAQTVLYDLAQSAAREHGCQFVRIHHATGEVAPGEASVFVQVACAHRDAAFKACRAVIDGLKAHAPIWKEERWENAATWSPGQSVNVKGNT